MQQIAVSRVQFNQIETGVTGIAHRLTEIIDDPRISSVSRARGIEVSARMAWPFSSRSEVRVPALSADGATGAAPPGCRLLWEIRPVCHSCTAIWPFSA